MMHYLNLKLSPWIAVLSWATLSMVAPVAISNELADGYWTSDQARSVLAKTLRVHLSPPLGSLSANEQVAIQTLLEVGQIMQRLYEASRHPEALAAHQELLRLDREQTDPARTKMLLDLYRLARGPVVTSLENERGPFLPVTGETPGKNVYPVGIEKDEIEGILAVQPELRPALLNLRYIVRRSAPENLERDLSILDLHPVLSVLHPGLRERLISVGVNPAENPLYALPYSVAYADDILQAFRLLHKTADLLDKDDPAFARFLRNRARDLLTDNYEAGDASWVTGRFKNLNAQIGSYETYDDQLYGVKTFFGLSLLLRDHARSAELGLAIKGLQDIEDSLPYKSFRKIQEDIPIGVYNVIADFGQSRGANSATILPNESFLARQYGRTILLRGNLLTHPQIFAISRASFTAAVHEDYWADLTQDANLYRILWHEVGHYLGVDQTTDGRDLGEALEDSSDLFEEMKADLVSLFVVRLLAEQGFYTEHRTRAVYASGILRVLQKNRPRRNQPYATMQLMQWNWFLEYGVLQYDTGSSTLRIHYDHFHDAVEALLAEVLTIQSEGDRTRAESFIRKYTAWDDGLHGVIADKMTASEVYRYVMVSYEALGDPQPVAE